MDRAQQHKATQTRFDCFSAVVQLLSGVGITRVDSLDELAGLDFQGAPQRLAELFHALGSNPGLAELPEDAIACLALPHELRFAFARLSGDGGVIVLGPYRNEQDAGPDERGARAHEQDGSVDDATATYLGGLPVLSKTQAAGTLIGLMNILYDTDTLVYPIRDLRAEPDAENDAERRKSERPDGVDLDQAQAVAQRYEAENAFLDAVASGDEERAVRALGLKGQPLALHRSPDTLRDCKNTTIVLNTLMRKKLEECHVHPVFIDAISSRWGMRIERITLLSEAHALPYRMTVDYCRTARYYTTAGLSPNVRAAVSYILEHYTDPKLSLTAIASDLSLSPTYLSHQFNEELGLGIPDFVTRVRIDRAQGMLRRDESRTISAIARAVGFSDQGYFARRFKAIVGFSPSEYRKHEPAGQDA